VEVKWLLLRWVTRITIIIKTIGTEIKDLKATHLLATEVDMVGKATAVAIRTKSHSPRKTAEPITA